MTLPSSGPLSLNDIQGEFGGSNPIGMNEYYAGGGLVPSGTTGTYGAVPSSGTISVQNFYGTSNYVPIYIEDVFATYVYKGVYNTPVTVNTGVNLSTYGGLLWIKDRSSAISHQLWDSARTPYYKLASNTDEAQNYNATYNVAFSTTGFTDNNLWDSSENIVSWSFRKQPKFFDVVTYTGNSVAGRTVSHNLGSTPGFIIVKKYNASGNWACYHQSLGATQGFYLNSVSGSYSTSAMWNNTAPTSSVFTVGDDFDVNLNGNTYVAYLFASDAGGFGLTGSDNVINCGTFTTPGSGGVNMVSLGFEPQYLLLKRVDTAQSWYVADVMRSMVFSDYNGNSSWRKLSPNTNGSESTENGLYPNATGFTYYSGSTISGAATYVYVAIRRPMKVPTVGTTVFNPVARTADGNTFSSAPSSLRTVDSVLTKWRDTFNSGYPAWPWGTRLIGANRDVYTYSTLSEAAESNWGYHSGFDVQYAVSLQAGAYGQQLVNYTGYYVDYFFARAPGFYDVVGYRGTGSTLQDINHSLGVTPEMIIVKSRQNSGYWNVYTPALPAVNQIAVYLNDNNNGPSGSGGAAIWNLTSTTFKTNYNSLDTNVNGELYVAHLFATCPGVSKVGSYTGTGALQTIDCGFTTGARFVLIRRVSSGDNWYVWDSARGISSGSDPYLVVNSRDAEVTGTNYVDTTSVGFQVTAAAPSGINGSGATFIFLAIA